MMESCQRIAPFVCMISKVGKRSDAYRTVSTFSTGHVWTVGWTMIRKRVLFVEHHLCLMRCGRSLINNYGLLLESLIYTVSTARFEVPIHGFGSFCIFVFVFVLGVLFVAMYCSVLELCICTWEFAIFILRKRKFFE